MSRMYSSLDAAAEIGTTPRLLRRFIRQNPSWKNATYAGRYSFTQSEFDALKRDFEKWQNGRSTRKSVAPKVNEELTYLDEDQGVSVEWMHAARKNPVLRKEIMRRRRERALKLDRRIAEVGLRNNPAQGVEVIDAAEYFTEDKVLRHA